ncbi:hypothetical protein LUZ61_007504 [Rhynchospora tenuis]|uniref:X8 domain-containing protein n=1 Tax=Rhynchospora tenuis TaxID=198213 RepID=A0AAD5ZTT1_9POAL|nr:hypothetical protein LUZ61_007504 [Rhynchospora tenuis]
MANSSTLFFSLFSLLLLSTSGSIMGFPQDDVEKTSTFLQTNKNFNIQNLVFTPTGTSTSTSTVSTYLFLDPFQGTKWVETNPFTALPSLNISAIVVIGGEKSLIPSLSLLKSIYTSLKSSGFNSDVKVSIVFSLSSIANMLESRNKYFEKITSFIKNSGSFMLIETSTDKTFLDLITSIPNLNIPLVLCIKGYIPQIYISKFKLPLLKKKIFSLHLEGQISNLAFHSHHRDLTESPLKSTSHDAYDQVPNPAYTTPITVPSTNPAPPVVTVLPTNPTMPTGTIPPLNPYPTPITVPATNPAPTTPVTNPVTTPATNPVTTYPYPYPQTGTGTTTGTGIMPTPTLTPTYTPPVTMPGTTPVGTVPGGVGTMPSAGQTWCVAKSGIPDAMLQTALDYACGIGGADCTGIQPMGGCYNPNSVQAHASYAFNSYYQRNPSPTSCDFGGAGMLTNVNPSVGTCIFPSSSLSSGYTPTTPTTTTTPSLTPAPIYGTGTGITTGTNTGTGVSSGSTALNSGSSSVFAPDTPTATTNNSASLSACWTIVLFIFTFICLEEMYNSQIASFHI